MLQVTQTPLRPVKGTDRPEGDYFLSDVSLEIPSPDTALFKAKLHGPAGASVWTRAWLSTEADGTLAETASEALKAGEMATLTITLRDSRIPESAWIRIESAPLKTEHVVGIRLK